MDDKATEFLDCPDCGGAAFGLTERVWTQDEQEHCEICGSWLIVIVAQDGDPPSVAVLEHAVDIIARLTAERDALEQGIRKCYGAEDAGEFTSAELLAEIERAWIAERVRAEQVEATVARAVTALAEIESGARGPAGAPHAGPTRALVLRNYLYPEEVA